MTRLPALTKLATPRAAWPLWLAAVVLLALTVPLVMYDGYLYYAEGGTSPDAPGMFLASMIFTMPVWGSVWLLFVAAYLVRYPGRATLFPVSGKTVVSYVLVTLALAATLFMLWAALLRVEFWRPSRWPFAAYWLSIAVYLQYLRAAAAERSRR